jgi:ferredoxin
LGKGLEGACDALKADLVGRREVWRTNESRLRKHELKIPLAGIPGIMAEGQNHPVWKEKAELCYSCGSCNLVCPTCYCFDVRDEVSWDLKSGHRERFWDGCLLAPFARVAGNHNFRGTREARYRHRYYRKGMYIPGKIGESGCVGCGRCIGACTAGIANPVEVFNRLGEVKA